MAEQELIEEARELRSWLVDSMRTSAPKSTRYFREVPRYSEWLDCLRTLGEERSIAPCQSGKTLEYTSILVRAGEDPNRIKTIFTLLFL